ncbi:MAG: NCS2 family permease, partial [Phycisphaerae bacterium]|nr:NCS2 family permease [Phycisphaerae bacterium]
GAAGMNAGGVIFATCVASAIGCAAMGLLANYPVALAPGMGENAFFAFTLAATMGGWELGMAGWQPALALTMVAGVIFLVLSFTGLRAHIVRGMPAALRYGVAAGIGLLIATVGLQNANVVTFQGIPMAVPLGGNTAAWIALIGLGVLLVLSALRVPGAVLISILVNAALAMFVFRILPTPQAVFATNVFDGVGSTVKGGFVGFGGLVAALGAHWVEILGLLVVLLFMDIFDTIGTLVGVCSQAGMMKDGELPRVERALAADAIATSVGGALGTSTVTSYVESATGVAAGARTGLSTLVVAGLMIVALFFRPLIELIGGGVPVDGGGRANPMIAPALIFVGALMLRAIREVDWDDITEYFPAFLCVIVMPLTMSISHGIAIGFISYAAGKVLTGKGRSCSMVVYIVAALFVGRYVFGVIAGVH